MSKVIDENTVLQVGKFYKVRCAKIKRYNGGIHYIPVIGGIHKDLSFGTSSKHIHIDGRFCGINSYFAVDGLGRTNNIVYTDNEFFTHNEFVEFVVKRKKCFRLTTGINPPNPENFDYYGERQGLKYWKWYKSMVGKSCAGKRCPHFGTVMHEQDGKLVCPLHNLTGDIETEVIISLPQVEIACGVDEKIGKSFEQFIQNNHN